jgi:hypothetical protein
MPISISTSNPKANNAPSEPETGMDSLKASLTSLTLRAATLAKSVALHLGMDAASADLVGNTATLTSGDKTITLLPLGQTDDGALSLMLSVSTTLPIAAPPDGLPATQVLLHAPGALSAFSVALGATPDGHWMLYRSLVAGANDGHKVAQAVISTVRLADFVLDPATAAGH